MLCEIPKVIQLAATEMGIFKRVGCFDWVMSKIDESMEKTIKILLHPRPCPHPRANLSPGHTVDAVKSVSLVRAEAMCCQSGHSELNPFHYE
jgi:hypothetical protein